LLISASWRSILFIWLFQTTFAKCVFFEVTNVCILYFLWICRNMTNVFLNVHIQKGKKICSGPLPLAHSYHWGKMLLPRRYQSVVPGTHSTYTSVFSYLRTLAFHFIRHTPDVSHFYCRISKCFFLISFPIQWLLC
jgi:hypothetical protein